MTVVPRVGVAPTDETLLNSEHFSVEEDFMTPCRQTLILLVDSQPEVLREASQALSAAGHLCHACRTGTEALEFVQTATPDLIVTSVNLQGSSGLDLFRHLQNALERKDIPGMFLSGIQTPDVIRRSQPTGGAYYLRKPLDVHVLTTLVNKVTRPSRHQVTPSAPHVPAPRVSLAHASFSSFCEASLPV